MRYTKKDILIINNTGFDGGGSQTIGRELNNLGYNVIFRDVVKYRENNVNNQKTYSDINELEAIIKDNGYKYLVFNVIDFLKPNEKTYQPFYELKKKLKDCIFIYISCNRTDSIYKKESEVLKTFDEKLFDYVLSFHKKNVELYTQDIAKEGTVVDINVFDPFTNDIKFKELSERNKNVVTLGRIEAIKGIQRYLSELNNIISNNDFAYIHEGVYIKWRKDDQGRMTSSVPFPVVGSLFNSVQDKVLKPNYIYKNDYIEFPEINKLNIYPNYVYNKDTLERWSKHLVIVSPLLGEWDKKIQSKIKERYCMYFEKALEYVNTEAILSSKTPVLFSRDFAKLIGFNVEELIYDDYFQIPQKIEQLISNEEHYSKVFHKQYYFFLNRQLKINDDFLKAILSINGGE